VPVLTSTVTILSAFIPLLFWPGIVGEFMKFLPITLITTLTASLFVAYVISPVQAAEFINYRKEIKKAKFNLEHPHWYKKYNPLTILYHKVDEQFFPWAQENYVKTLQWTLQNKWKTLGSAFALLLVIVILFGMFNKGVEFFPETEPSQVSVSIDCPAGASLEVTNAISKILEERLESIPGRKDVEFIGASVGTSDDMFDFGGQGTANKGKIAINFHEQNKRTQNSFITMEEIRKITLGIAGADIRLSKQQMGPPVGDPVSIEIAGEDYGQLAALSKAMRERIKDVPGLVDLKDNYNTGRPEVEIVVDREKAGLFYTSTGQIASTVRAAIAGVEASKYRVGEDEYKIRVRLQEDQRTSPADLENLRINFMNRRGQLLSIPLTSVADIRRTTSVTDIRRKDMKRVITVSGNISNRVQSEVLKDVKQRLTGLELPAGYTVSLTGSQEDQQEASDFLSKAFIVTLLMVFLIMVMEFNSMKVPFVIMISVILSLIGVLFGLLVTRTALSVMMTGVGIVALAGIVVRNGIILLDFVKHKQKEGGLSLDEALVEAGRVRLRPVILTAAAAVLALIPMGTGYDFNWSEFHFVTGSESAGFWRPLAVAIIFGLTISTFLTLVIVPTAYSLIDEYTEKTKGWIKEKFKERDY
jgi:multidrug efflux pump subunit AcrB